MKKIIIFLISLFLFPIATYASKAVSNVNYDIKQDYFLVNIRENGSADVKELIVYKGSFNGVLLNLGYNNPNLSYNTDSYESNAIYNFDGYSNIKISAKNVKSVSFDTFNELGFKEFTFDQNAEKGDTYKFDADVTSDEYRFKIYHATRSDTVAFLYEYTLENIVVMHPDTAEFYWQIFDQDPDRDDMRDVRVRVYLPDADTKENFMIWTHDILDSKINYLKNSNGELVGLEVIADKVNQDDLLDVRTIFNKDLITDDSNLDYFEGEGKSGVIKVEKRRAEEADRERERLKNIYTFFKYASFVILGGLGFGFLYASMKLRKPKVDFDADYYREFIDDYNVEVIDYLFKKSLTPNALSAAIMNLIYLKKIEAEEILDPKKSEKKDDKDYKFTLIDREGLDESNEKLVGFLFDVVGDGNEFTTTGLKKYASSLKTGGTFNSNYTKWNHTVTSCVQRQCFYKSKSGCYLIAILLFIVALIFSIIGFNLGVDFSVLPINILVGIVLIIYVAKLKGYTEKGALHLAKWKAFKRFLNDFGEFSVKELPEVKLWERYLVYAVIFGIAKKVQKDMNVKIKEIEGFDSSTTMTPTLTRIYLYDSIRSSFAKSVTDGRRQYAASRANAYSSSSSRGFGGGGSFGGGFGGGGGGRGGF